MKRFSRVIPLLAAAVVAVPLAACGGGNKDDQPELTPAQFMDNVRKQPGVQTLPDGWPTRCSSPARRMERSPPSMTA